MTTRTIGAIMSILLSATFAGAGGLQIGRLMADTAPVRTATAVASSPAQADPALALTQDVESYIMEGPVALARQYGLRDERIEPLTVLDNNRTGDDNEQIIVVRLSGLDDDGPIAYLLGVYLQGTDHTPVRFEAYDYEQ